MRMEVEWTDHHLYLEAESLAGLNEAAEESEAMVYRKRLTFLITDEEHALRMHAAGAARARELAEVNEQCVAAGAATQQAAQQAAVNAQEQQRQLALAEQHSQLELASEQRQQQLEQQVQAEQQRQLALVSEHQQQQVQLVRQLELASEQQQQQQHHEATLAGL